VACIYVLAGTNGAGKSSIGGAFLEVSGAAYFNPDDAARRFLAVNPTLEQERANSAAWNEGKHLLERAIGKRENFAFETTLGGHTIPALLNEALVAGIEVRVWYVGLADVELHIARVRSRVRSGGHDIPEKKIRERYVRSRWNLLQLMPRLTELAVYDNSDEANPAAGVAPKPRLILHLLHRKIIAMCAPNSVPDWAKPIVVVALKLKRSEKI
jgi:predicted ABC-type ATPase